MADIYEIYVLDTQFYKQTFSSIKILPGSVKLG